MKLRGDSTGFECMEYQDMEHGEVYAVTINPSDLHQRWFTDYRQKELTAITRKALFIDNLKKHLNVIFFNVANLKLYGEYSHTGRLHVHGYITVYDKETFYSICLDRLRVFSQYCFKPIKDDDKWAEYCKKQRVFKLKITGYVPDRQSPDIVTVDDLYVSKRGASKRVNKNS